VRVDVIEIREADTSLIYVSAALLSSAQLRMHVRSTEAPLHVSAQLS
jgi:hypothetical protein